ncbi:EcsC family protein [Exiguobacterium sp. S90]|uniref:EcsC family protein n=1 Tax=Exiguobacterium sp. S90 TaxID=1221231 RepID=UPI001BEA5B74|nr:EcsC family protein [Exiguobacterium sp. S90]
MLGKSNFGLSKMNEVLDWGYEKAIQGGMGIESAYELADEYQGKYGVEQGINKLVNVQLAKCGTSGFLSGLGGIVTLPIAIPANVSSVIFIQLRMIAAVAHLRGYDLKSDEVRTFVYTALTGKAATDILKNAGIQVGSKVTVNLIKKIPGEVILRINRAVGMRLVTKFGEKGVMNLGKMIPLVGGVIGGTFDVASTKTIAEVAKNMFVSVERTIEVEDFEDYEDFSDDGLKV